MKRLSLLITFLLALSTLNAQETYRFRTDHPQGFSIETSSKSALSLHYSIAELGIANVQYDEAKGQEIILKGCFASNAESLPNLPFVNQYIAVPRGAKVSIEVKEKASKTLQNVELLPAAPLQMNGEDERPNLHWNVDIFGKDADFPSENVTIAQTTQIRGLDVAMISVTPFRYNPVWKTLEVLYDMDIEVHFEGGDGQFGNPRYHHPAWDHILRDLVINSDMLPEAHYYEHLNEVLLNREEGCEYLIIVPDDSTFIAWADTLKAFRTKQGILTKVVTASDCGSNEAEDIRNYILNAYNNWAIPPAAVLFLGGNQKNSNFGLKPFIYTMPHNDWEVYHYPTDNPFADMNGDSIPDLAISRFAAYNANECETLVKKAIDYELNPPTDPHYYDHPVITSGYEEDKWFMITSQITHNYLRDRLGKHPSNIYMKYYWVDQNPTPPDSIWSTDSNTPAALDYFGPNGTSYIPMSLGGLDNWIDEFNDTQVLIDAINEGGFLTFFRDHSNRELWACPIFETSDILQLQNKRPTFVLSIGCLTSDYWHTEGNGFSELFCKTNAGAVGLIGANSVTYSHYNDPITWGIFDYFWPDFMPTLGTASQPEFAYPSFSLVAGKIFLAQQSFRPFWAEGINRTQNLFSYLGDTYLDIYTEMPQPLSIEAPRHHPNSEWEYHFTAEEGTVVCLSRNGKILHVLQATGQQQSVTLPQMEIGEQFTITATKHNRIRHEQTVTVIASDVPFVYMTAATLNDQEGNGQLDYGEYATVDVTLRNDGLVASQGSDLTLLCESSFVDILKGTAQYQQILPNSTATLKNAFRIRLANDIPDQTLLQFKVQFNEGNNTHQDGFECLANAPLIKIDPEFQIVTDDNKPSTHIVEEGRSFITFTLQNVGHAATEHLSTDLSLKAPFVSVTTPNHYEYLAPNDRLTVTHELNTTPNDITGAWLQSQLHIQYGEYHTYCDTIVQFGGLYENFETDTLNPLFGWRNNPYSPWTYCNDDAFEGQRSFEALAESNNFNPWFENTAPNNAQLQHPCKVSFYYRTSPNGTITFRYYHDSQTVTLPPNDDWLYFEQYMPIRYWSWTWRVHNLDENPAIGRIDNICFPPMHTTIASAGGDIISCHEGWITLSDAYAYDCDSVLWTTEGDGFFESDTLVNAMYFPGNQDLENGEVTLTLYAFGNDTVVSTTTVRFVDDVVLGSINGDSIVNKNETPVSHYSIENPNGMGYLWQLEPATAGSIYDYGDKIDILWNPHENDMDVTLRVSAENGCDIAPASKSIQLIDTYTPVWHTLNFDLYPNPTDGHTNLVMGETLKGKAFLEVFNLLGERVISQQVNHLYQGETISLDLSKMASGLYIIRLSAENGCCSKKVSVR